MDGHGQDRVFSIEHKPEPTAPINIPLQRFQKAWSVCEPIIQDVLFSQNSRILDQVARFLTSATIPERSQFLPFSTAQPLPTAVVLGGSPTTLSSLSSAWSEDRPTPLLARLNARDATGLKSTLRTLIARLIASGQTLYTPKVGTSNAIKGKRPSMLSDDNFELFKAWYATHASHGADKPKVVISLEDFEAFDPIILEDLVHILSRYRTSIPIVLLFGVQTSVDAVNVLPYASKPLLRIQTFILQSGETTLTELFQAILVKRTMPLSISARVFERIRDQFNDTDASILTVVAKIRYIYLLHFLLLPVSEMTLPNLPQQPPAGPSTLLSLQHLPSFKSTAERMLAQECELSELFISAGENDVRAMSKLLEESRSQRAHFERQRRVALAAYDVLSLIFKDPRRKDTSLLGDQLLDLLSGHLLRKSDEALKLFRRATSDTLSTTLKYLVDAFKWHEDASFEQIQNFEASLHSYEDLARRFQEDRQKGLHHRQQLQNVKQLEGLGALARKGQTNLSDPTAMDEQFTAIVQTVADQLEELFEAGFKAPSQILFHELWYFDDPDQLQQAFHPDMLGSAETAVRSEQSLQSNLLPVEAQRDVRDNDLAAAHRLLQDAGKLVNLGDWYQSFVGARPLPAELAIKKSTAQGKKRKQSESVEVTEEEESQRKARFIRAVSETAWLGFIHASKRKVEHVGKVVF